DDDNFNYDMDHQSTKETEVTEDLEEASDAVKSIVLENHEENEITIHGDQRVWVKPSDELFTDQIKEEISECEYQTIIDVKDEIEEIEEEEIKIQPPIVCEPIQPPPPPPPAIDIQVKKNALPKLNFKTVKKPRGRMGRRPRPILPMTQPIASASTSHLEQAQHQIIMPSPQMPGIAYQIFLGDHGKNSNNPVQYTMLQPRPVFLQQTSTPVTTPSSVMISQPYPVTRSQVSTPKIPKIAPKSSMVSQTYCSFCYKLFKNVKEHVKECWANPASKSYKFRKIAPSTPL
ncbi:uncharacterized protein LOC132917892, partial [Rhopalosiphum padi]|uniref:uncharacterized protein LOC132917892 n=1 Tax=Rhopalosiphum padi TaxID=40932 RepID=UPI00298D867B